MIELLMELDHLIKAGRLPHGDCGVFVGQRCNCFHERVPRLLALARSQGHLPPASEAAD